MLTTLLLRCYTYRHAGSAVTSETRYIYADQPTSDFTLVLPRVNVSHSAPLACGPLRVTLGPLAYLTVPRSSTCRQQQY